jgi:hypothetical protein
VPRIAEIAGVTEVDVAEQLARYRDYEASFTGYPTRDRGSARNGTAHGQ